MTRKVKSIKGEEVDFDLFEIKEQMSQSPKTDNVLMRERYIDRKRRRTRPKTSKLVDEQEQNKSRVQRALEKQKRKQKDNAKNKAKEQVVEPKDSEVSNDSVTTEKSDAKKTTKKKRVVRKKT